jgi:hypothetical protein
MTTNRLLFSRVRYRGSDSRARPRRLPLVLTLVAILSVAGGVEGAGAFRGWCRADPQFQIGGDLVLVTIDAQVRDMRAARRLSTGPIRIVLTVPTGTRAKYLASNDGFGQGYDVVIEHSHELNVTGERIPVQVAVYVPLSDSAVAIRTSFVPAGSADQAHVKSAPGRSAGKGRNNGVLMPGDASGTANEWIVMTT